MARRIGLEKLSLKQWMHRNRILQLYQGLLAGIFQIDKRSVFISVFLLRLIMCPEQVWTATELPPFERFRTKRMKWCFMGRETHAWQQTQTGLSLYCFMISYVARHPQKLPTLVVIAVENPRKAEHLPYPWRKRETILCWLGEQRIQSECFHRLASTILPIHR